MTVGIEQKKGQTVASISIDIPLKRFRKDLGFLNRTGFGCREKSMTFNALNSSQFYYGSKLLVKRNLSTHIQDEYVFLEI